MRAFALLYLVAMATAAHIGKRDWPNQGYTGGGASAFTRPSGAWSGEHEWPSSDHQGPPGSLRGPPPGVPTGGMPSGVTGEPFSNGMHDGWPSESGFGPGGDPGQASGSRPPFGPGFSGGPGGPGGSGGPGGPGDLSSMPLPTGSDGPLPAGSSNPAGDNTGVATGALGGNTPTGTIPAAVPTGVTNSGSKSTVTSKGGTSNSSGTLRNISSSVFTLILGLCIASML